MVRYFFDVEDDGSLYTDSEGTELKTLEAARLEATQALAEIVLDLLPGSTEKRLTMLARDDGGRKLFELILEFKFTPFDG